MISRRTLLAVAALSLVSCIARAQAPADLPRLALVEAGDPVTAIAEGGLEIWDALLSELRLLGHVEGETITIDRWAPDSQDAAAYARLAEQVIASAPDIILPRGTQAIIAFAEATTTIPILGAGAGMEGLVGSLARPGRNVTGIHFPIDINVKRLQMLGDAVPAMSRVGWIGTEVAWASPLDQAVQQGAPQLGLTLIPAFVAMPISDATIAAAIAELAGQDLDALYVSSTPAIRPWAAAIAAAALAAGLPAIGFQRDYAEVGLLMAYGPDLVDAYRDLAGYVDRLLDGAAPEDLPIAQPRSFELVVNLRTAEALGLTLPETIPELRHGVHRMIGRRELLTVASTTLAWPLAGRAQQPALPVVGFLHSQSAETFGHLAAAFLDGLSEAGYVAAEKVAIEQRWAEGQADRLPALAAELVGRPVAVIAVGGGNQAILAAKAATAAVPVVFVSGPDPVESGFVDSFSRPGGNLTGVALLSGNLEQKRLGLLHELLPSAAPIAVLVNPTNTNFAVRAREYAEASRLLGVQLRTVSASTEQEIDAAFATLAQDGAKALQVSSNTFFNSRRDQITALAARYGIPAIYEQRDFVAAGGLMSYGASVTAAYRQAGVYVGRILDGEAPGDLPVIQATTFDLAVNLRTAAALGITVPRSILIQATELIE